eukprot:CAMPEP_0202441448 /NCGR_PEP_ID=MMETSP1360-20130828/974_1 /ASSEMBLY_ACC=CAM_ASM_000848 /TAXON_ID=515479 /ORGANISM="Licmophora paradoxa, Strain CCMP2313" /LENGTH=30 /DNA_ID= /DNA_START= /DNA_END= /DNA_ORIENTATION=
MTTLLLSTYSTVYAIRWVPTLLGSFHVRIP